jgi:hypothetical protein
MRQIITARAVGTRRVAPLRIGHLPQSVCVRGAVGPSQSVTRRWQHRWISMAGNAISWMRGVVGGGVAELLVVARAVKLPGDRD